MLLNNRNTIKKGFAYLKSDTVMNFLINNFGDQIDPLDRHNNNYAIALCNLIIEQQIEIIQVVISCIKQVMIMVKHGLHL